MISVCLATYNGAKFLQEQLDSILPQLSSTDEVIISDDGSSDGTLELLHQIADARIKIFQNKNPHGFVHNFENALKQASGDYIFLSDQDDVWKKNKVQIVLQALGHADLIVHDADLVNGKMQSLGRNYYSTLHHHTGFLMNLYKTRFLGCCMAFNRKVQNAVLPFPSGIVGHDYWIGMYALLHFKVLFISDSLMYYRRHGNNASPSSEKSNASLYWQICIKRWGLIKALMQKR